MSNRGYKILLFMTAAIWGGGFPITKIALNYGTSPNAILAVRFLAASVILFAYLCYKREKITRSEVKLGLFTGVFLSLGFSFQTVGLSYTTASKNAFLTGTYVVLTPFFAWLFTRKMPKKQIYFSCFLSLLGIFLLSWSGENVSMQFGDVLSLLCAVFYAIQISYMSAKIGEKNPLHVNFFQMLSAGILTLIYNIVLEGGSVSSFPENKVQLFSVGFLVVFNTLLAYSAQTLAQKYVESSLVCLILSTEILFGAFISFLFLGEILSFQSLLGGFLMFLSIFLAEFDWKKKSDKESITK
ncbi:DMT family transporter [Fusobacterium gonidiaformans]|uniref:DMT family transporter n=1 Tax=Fusobacterium gonidiaformans TaxID=849 RepID=UPI0023F1A564|nr:DMT family transporter [Fusobacterium gonidiaformans]